MSHMTVTPAYGRDYTSKAKALADWHAGKDFIHQPTGRYIGIHEATGTVHIRYSNLMKVCVV